MSTYKEEPTAGRNPDSGLYQHCRSVCSLETRPSSTTATFPPTKLLLLSVGYLASHPLAPAGIPLTSDTPVRKQVGCAR